MARRVGHELSESVAGRGLKSLGKVLHAEEEDAESAKDGEQDGQDVFHFSPCVYSAENSTFFQTPFAAFEASDSSSALKSKTTQSHPHGMSTAMS